MEEYWDRYEDTAPAWQRWARSLGQERRVRLLATLEQALLDFSPGERLALYVLSALLALSALILISGAGALASVTVPAPGGSLVEGETGPVRFINPLLALSQADKDLTALVYSGLTRALPDGSIVPDLASEYRISSDGRVYTFKLRPGATFQDGTKVTSADVVFTVQEALDPGINSPQRANWTGVTVSAPDDETVVFTLPHAYAPFIYDTTLGVLPKHLWQNIAAEEFPFSPLNTHPIGSGPYKMAGMTLDSNGAPARYDLVPFEQFALGPAYLSRISFVFYPDTDALLAALNGGSIDAAAALSPEDLAKLKRSDLNLAQEPLPRVFGVFFNQSHDPVLTDLGVREALDEAIDKQGLVESVLSGRGEALEGPIPPALLGGSAPAVPQKAADIVAATSTPEDTLLASARATLQADGWSFSSSTNAWTKKKQVLSLALATADDPELVAAGHALVAAWQRLGAQVSLQIYPLSEFNTNVLRPRDYDALLFGEVVGPELDLYAFWHSSQRNDPGLNLAMYANSSADSLLSQARATTGTQERDSLYRQFAGIVGKDHPAVFLFAPDFLYIVPESVRGIALGAMEGPESRFANVYQWYADTEQVWAVFNPAHTITSQ